MGQFHRTKDGLLNLHLFSSSDCIVFVEGGKYSYNLEQIKNNNFSKESPDIIFWEGLFEKISNQNKKFEFRAVGSCETLEAILFEIGNKSHPTIKICLDKDRKEFWGTIYSSPCYTRGYSWENELINPVVIRKTLFTLIRTSPSDIFDDVTTDINNLISEIRSSLSWAVHADIVLGGMGSSLLYRNTPNKSLDTESTRPYLLAKPRLRSRYRCKRRGCSKKFREKKTITDTIANVPQNPELFCFGHLVSKIFYRVIEHLVKKYGKWQNIHFEIIENIGINQFLTYLVNNKNSLEYKYYEKQLLS